MPSNKTSPLRKALRKAHAYDPDITVLNLLVLLEIQSGPASVGTLAQKLNATQPAISRIVDVWSDWGRGSKQGRQFVSKTEDPTDRRSKILELTPKGKAWLKALLE